MSPWVRHRLVHEYELAAAALDHPSSTDPGKFIQEVFWRTYWKGWLELRPALWSRYVAVRNEAIACLDTDPGLNDAYTAAIEGRTGIDCFDSWAKELLQTGYLHNHARMWFASIWVFTLNLPWTLGADFFHRHLMDGDPASNTLSWRWVCGLQTRGKVYAATASNISKFTEGRFHPSALNENPEPLDDEPFPEPAPLAPLAPLPEGQQVFLIIGDDDCRAETPDFGSNDIVAAAAWDTIDTRSPLPVGETARHFTLGALGDAASRFGGQHKQDIATPQTANALADRIRESGVRHVLMSMPPTGPNRTAFDTLQATLADDDIRLSGIRRPWDARAWPYATKGFFAFREKIPQLLQNAGLEVPPDA